MTFISNQQFTIPFANDTIVTAIYKAQLEVRLEDGWDGNDVTAPVRQAALANSNHNLAVMLDWVTAKANEVFAFLADPDAVKNVRSIYLTRMGVQDITEALIGKGIDLPMIKSMVSDVVTQVRREVMPALDSNSAFTLEEAEVVMSNLWYFMTDGLVGTKEDNLLYGADVLVFQGVVIQPTTLDDTEVDETEVDYNSVATDLENIFQAN